MVKNYGDYPGIDIWMGEWSGVEEADYVVSDSAGSNYVLSLFHLENKKLVLVNPLIKKRSFVVLIWRDLKFLLFEGLPWRKIIPIWKWWGAFWLARRLARIDVLAHLRSLPKENITIIRGMRDRFFCDDEAVQIIKQEGWRLIEVDAGHDWNANIADAVKSVIP